MRFASRGARASVLSLALCLPLVSTLLFAQDESTVPGGDTAFAPQAEMTAGQGEVLVLYGLSSEMPAYTEWSGGIREGLQDAQGNTPNINVEFLDLSRFDDQAYTQLWLELLRQKYAQRDIRVLIPVLGATLRFTTAHLRELFPNAAVVFTSVDEREAVNLPDDSGITGIVYRADIRKTCELALQLRPHTRRFVCISGSSVIGKSLDQLARRELESLGTGIEADYWNGVPLDELKRRVRNLPDDHALVFLFYLTDENGEGYVPAKVAAELCDESTVPVFGFYSTVLQHGIVGGHMSDPEAQAVAAGRMARQVFDGEDPDNLPIHGQELNRAMVHWKRLQKWNIPESNVPAHAIVLDRQPTLWESYRWQIVATFAIVILQFVLIVALLLNRIQRRRAEQALLASQDVARQQRDELARVNRVTTAGEFATSIAHEVNQPLSAIVSNSQAALRLLGQSEPDTNEITAALQDITNDGNRAAGILNRVRSMARKEPPTLTLLNLNEVIHDVLRLAAPDAEAREIVIREELDDALPTIMGDSLQLQQVILNLLINAGQAMRDVEPGARRITIGTTNDGGAVHLSVEDCGIGLDDEQLNQIFDAFYTSRIGGIGMGLSISQSIIEAHEGKIWATQNPQRGATFHVTLPVAQ